MREPRDTESVGTLIRRLVADGRAYATAEIDVYRQKALAWVPPVRTAAIMLVVALFLVQAALTTLIVFLGFWLALWIGPLGGGIAAVLIALAVAGILAKMAIGKLSTPPPGVRS
ncbi:phage holin family protein [Sphingomonas profundi]|uniref:phage holin family protein n=1 Tax=Alterirhizorhabdus profundi TaxID=2681549 RepID=UPI0012E8F805|nr:phage holin family protein [Sphingomonas profundi]